jgi:hypothetical protein
LQYEFFAGIIHRGTAYSGHYHVVIRDLEQEVVRQQTEPIYLDFNDTIINEVDAEYLNKFKKKGEENFYLLIYRQKGPWDSQKIVPVEDEVMLSVRLENEQISATRAEYDRMKQCIRVYVANLGVLAEAGVVSVDTLATHEEEIDGAVNPKFLLDKSNPEAFYNQVEMHFGIRMDDFQLFLARFKYNGSIYYVEKVDFHAYKFDQKDGVGMNSQLLLVNNAFLDFPVFATFKERNVG